MSEVVYAEVSMDAVSAEVSTEMSAVVSVEMSMGQVKFRLV